LHELQVAAILPRHFSPKFSSIVIAGVHEYVALLDGDCGQASEALFDEAAAEPPATIGWRDGQMVKISAAAVVAAQDGADEAIVFASNET
jgi:hypothetical protein